MLKKILLIIPLLFLFQINYGNAANITDESNFTNLIILAKFKDEEEFIDDYRDDILIRDIINNMYNESDYSLRNYYSIQSNNKINMKSVFLYDKNGNSITLSNPREYYSEYSQDNQIGYEKWQQQLRQSELIEDWSNAVINALENGGFISDSNKLERYDYSILDKNNDGIIDSINVLYKESSKTISASWASVLWNHQYICNNIKLSYNGKEIISNKYVQATLKNYSDTIYKDSNNKAIMNVGSITHEMGHIMGLYDLYSNNDESAVGYMSLMGKRLSPIPQNISIKEKEALGWLNEGQLLSISSNGQYKIKAIADYENGIIGYKLKINDTYTVYFEYRNFESINNTFDNKQKYLINLKGEQYKGNYLKSGLVCYLLRDNVRFPNNLNSTSLNWQYQALSYHTYMNQEKDGTKNRCALDNYAYWDDVESLGFNIEVLNMTNDELTFEISNYNPNNEEIVDDIVINSPNKLNKGDEYQLEYSIIGLNIDESAKINWSIKNNTSNKTYINDLNKLIIGDDEKAKYITVIAEYKNAVKNINIEIEHNIIHYLKIDSTCLNEGNIEYWYCEDCEKYYKDSHITEIEYKDIIISKKNHITEIIPRIDPTCRNEGLEEGEICILCNKIIIEQAIIPKIPHSLRHVKGISPNCTKKGFLDYDICDECGYSTYEELAPLGHNIVITEKIQPTCTSYGLTEGKKCIRCNEVIIPQKNIEKIDHVEGNWIIDSNNKYRHKECINCGIILEEEIIKGNFKIYLIFIPIFLILIGIIFKIVRKKLK